MADIPTAQEVIAYLEGYGVDMTKTSYTESFVGTAIDDLITVSGNYRYTTGTMVKFTTTGILPSPIVINEVYYAIYISDTTIKLATSPANAEAGTAIDLTVDGSGSILATEYCFVSADWINARIANNVIPNIEKLIRTKVDEEKEYTETHSGEGSTVLILDRKNIKELVRIDIITNNFSNTFVSIENIELLGKEGLLKAKHNFEEVYGLYPIFPRGNKNIQITFIVERPLDTDAIHEAIILIACDVVLGFVGGRTGGGASLGIQSYNRQYGDRGKWTDTRREFVRQAMGLLAPWMTGVVGS